MRFPSTKVRPDFNFTANPMKNASFLRSFFLSTLILLFAGMALAQDSIPEKPSPPRLVNDLAGILNENERAELEAKLVAFNDSTSVQICVVTVPTLGGYEKADYAQRLGQKWGVGDKKYDNGFIVLIKPKSQSERGEAFIATGYGVEKFVPDATTFQMVDNEMIPHFRENDYYGGINAGTDALMALVKGEYKGNGKKQEKEGSGIGAIIFIVLLVLFIVFRGNNNNNRTINRRGSGGPLFFPFIGGGFGGGGGGGFGGGGGGFGGFGGGSFGGGGAGGSW
jgi:uncharacterized protein